MIDCSSGDAFGVLSSQFLNTVLQCGVRLPIHTLNYWIAQSVVPAFQLVSCLTVIFPIFDLWQCCVCNPMHPLCGALPVPYVPVRVTRCTLIAHRYTYAIPSFRTSQYRRTFIPLSVSLWNALVDPVFDGVGLAGFKSSSNAFLLAQLLSPFLSSTIFPFFSSIGWQCGAGVFGLIGCHSPSPDLALPIFFNNNNNERKSGYWLLYAIYANERQPVYWPLYAVTECITPMTDEFSQSTFSVLL